MITNILATTDQQLACGLIHRYHLPSTPIEGGGKPAEDLLVIVHGRTGTCEVMWPFARSAQSLNPIIIAPQAEVKDELGGFSWWHIPSNVPSDTYRSLLTVDILTAAQNTLHEFIKNSIKEYSPNPPKRIFAMGFSQGAALVGSLALRMPELFSGVAVLAGFIPKVAFELSKPNSNLPPFFIAHGTKDETIPLSAAENAAERLRALGADVSFFTDDVGHKVGTGGIKAMRSWFEKFSNAKI
jgi:phospholipase/carboxylesterase